MKDRFKLISLTFLIFIICSDLKAQTSFKDFEEKVIYYVQLYRINGCEQCEVKIQVCVSCIRYGIECQNCIVGCNEKGVYDIKNKIYPLLQLKDNLKKKNRKAGTTCNKVILIRDELGIRYTEEHYLR